MALFTDGPISRGQDFQNYESGILDVANTENIDLTAKGATAQQEIGDEILLFLLRRATRDPQVIWWDPSALQRRRIGTGDVVVSEPLSRWHALRTLALFYRDAYFNQLNDRYQAKWQEYSQRQQDASDTFFQIGVGLVFTPTPKPSAPTLATVAGTGGADSYIVQITWVNAQQQEGAPSDPVTADTANGTQLTVIAPAAPINVTGWNVYAGDAVNAITLQNAVPIPAGQNWTMPSTGLAAGVAPGNGQTPDRWLINDRLIQRG